MRISGMRRSRGFSLLEMLVVITTICLLVTLLLPAVNAVREASRRCTCLNNMRQCMTALNNYNLVHGSLPPGSVDPGRPISSVPKGYHYSWIVQVLPYLDSEPLYDGFNFDLGVYHPHHQTLRLTTLNVLLCPSDPNRTPKGQPASSNIAGCHHHGEAPIDITNNGMLFLNSAIKPEQLDDGFSNTLLISEKDYETGDLGWASGTRATLRNTGGGSTMMGRFGGPIAFAPASPLSVGVFGSSHPGIVNAGFADGSAKALKGGGWAIYGARDKSKIELDDDRAGLPGL